MTVTRLLTTATLLAAAALSTGCVANSSLDDMTEINRRLEERVVDLEAQIARLRSTLAQKDETIGMMRGRGDATAAAIADRDRVQLALDNALAELARANMQLAEAANQQPEIIIRDVLPPEVSDALAELARANPDLMTFDEARGMIRLRSDLTFALGSADVNEGAKDALARLARVLNDGQARNFDIMVIGHTDNVPVTSAQGRQLHIDNRGLSSNRGDAVARVLEANQIAAARLTSGGRGATQPIAANGERGNQANRRVEIFLTKAGERPAVNNAPAPAAPVRGDVETAPRPGVVEGRPAVEDDSVFK
ncbi:MAG: OmpA family protein [Phycisphaerales bacterium JB063]